jgi:hypothetical protein
MKNLKKEYSEIKKQAYEKGFVVSKIKANKTRVYEKICCFDVEYQIADFDKRTITETIKKSFSDLEMIKSEFHINQ